MADDNFETDTDRVRDLARYPERRFLNRFDFLAPAALATAMYFLGETLTAFGTNGMQMLIWGFFVSTIILFHATCTINSLAHRFGTRRFETGEHSRNNWLLALITFGEDGTTTTTTPGGRPSGFLLVGNRYHLLRSEDPGVVGCDLGSSSRAGACLQIYYQSVIARNLQSTHAWGECT